MKLYPYQIEIINALRLGKNIVRAGPRRVGLTTAVLTFIESEIKAGKEFKALIYTKNPRSLLGLIEENKHFLPTTQLRPEHSTLSSIIQVSNTIHSRVNLEFYDDVSLPNRQMTDQWALMSTHGICHLPKNIHMPFEFMSGISYTDISQS